MVMLRAAGALLLLMGAASCGGAKAPIRGEGRTELCASVAHVPEFVCPPEAHRHGKPPPDGSEMWCQTKAGLREGPYRRFPADVTVSAPEYAADGVVIGRYRHDRQDGPWWTVRSDAREINVAYYQDGTLSQRVHCAR